MKPIEKPESGNRHNKVGFRWVITRLGIINKGTMFSILRNELGYGAHQKPENATGYDINADRIRAQRHSLVLKDVEYLQARMTGVADTSVTLRRAQFRAADDSAKCAGIARQIIAGKLQNSRNSLLRAARETEISDHKSQIAEATDALARQIQELGRWTTERLREPGALDALRGAEGMGAQTYFSVFTLLLKQQRDEFTFTTRTRRPPRDRINCLLSFLYALVRHDCIAGLTSIGLDPFVGFLHAERPNRPALALDLMEEFRPWLADRLAVTLVNRQQVGTEDFKMREGGAVEFTDAGRKRVIKAYQERKQEKLTHPLLDQEFRLAQIPFVQARVLARHLRGDLTDYIPLVPK
ncbi:MAG: CRISPR-associated endonuclease Cas1 [Verrucomicrobia bacterium]|nr:CRISPR-associated endonuclease Cas1 [Verrucomicrobiota bacterium]